MSTIVTTLPNGLKIVAEPMAHLDSLALGIWVGAGSRHEPEARMGISHMLEHMAFKGTATRSARQIAEEIEAVGGYLNAYTSSAETVYYTRLLREDLALGMDILSDILRRPAFDPQELERERGVILQEIARANDTPDDVVFQRLDEAAYPDQPVGRPILGTAEIVRILSRDDLTDHMSTHYGPDRIIIGAGGAIDPDHLVELAEAAFGDMAPRSAYPDIVPAHFDGRASLKEDRSEQLHLALCFDSVPNTSPDYFTAALYSDILGGGSSSRLFQTVREERGLAYSVYSSLQAFEDGGTATVYAGTGPDKGAQVLDLVAQEMNRMADGVREAELKRAKATARSSLLMARERPMARLDSAVGDLWREGRIVPPQEILERFEAVSAAEIAGFAARLIAGPAPAFAAVGPLADLPHYDKLCAALRS